MDNSIYEVTREDYKNFFEQIIPGSIHIEHVSAGIYTFTYSYSNKTGKKLCGRKSFHGENSHKKIPEKYYIYEMPDDDERRDPIPKIKLTLETPQEVQAFFNALNKYNQEHQNE